MIRHCEKASLLSRCIFAGVISVVGLFLTTSTCFALGLSNFGLTEEDLSQLAPPVADRVRDTLESVSGLEGDEERRAIDLVLVEELPAEIRKKLTIRRAEVAVDLAESVAIYGSLLDDTAPLANSNLRARIAYHYLQGMDFGSDFERLQRIDALMSPLLAVPSTEYDSGAISTLVVYAGAVRSLGYEVASPLLEPSRVEGSHNDRKADAAQVRMFYAIRSRDIVNTLIGIVEKQIRDQGGAKNLAPQQGPHQEDPLLSQLNSLHRTLDSAQTVIDLSLGHLDQNDEVYSESTALELIEQYNLKAPEPIPVPEPKSEAEIAAEQEAKELERAKRREELWRKSSERIAADTEREYGKPQPSASPGNPASSGGGFGADASSADSDRSNSGSVGLTPEATSDQKPVESVEVGEVRFSVQYIAIPVGVLIALGIWFAYKRG